jgi:hypothetical protein
MGDYDDYDDDEGYSTSELQPTGGYYDEFGEWIDTRPKNYDPELDKVDEEGEYQRIFMTLFDFLQCHNPLPWASNP